MSSTKRILAAAAGVDAGVWSPNLPDIVGCYLFERSALRDLRAEIYPLALPGEHRKAAGLVSGDRSDDFILARGVLRAVLAERFGPEAAALPIVRGAGDRPVLPGAGVPGFSISRSRHMLGIAVTAVEPIGLDIEEITATGSEPAGLSAVETLALQALPATQRQAAALLAWTLKEATAKRDGATMWSAPEAIDARDAIRWVSTGTIPPAGVHFGMLKLGNIDLAASVAF